MHKNFGMKAFVMVFGAAVPVLAAQMTPRQAFYFYAHNGDTAALQALKQQGYLIDVSDEYGNSALCEAVIKKDQTAIRTLVQMGADTDADCLHVASAKSLPQNQVAEQNARPVFPSKEAVKIPNPPPEPLTKNAKVGIGLGVTTLAAAGAGVAVLLSGGGGGGGGDTPKCAAGYDFYGTTSCHLTKECKTNAHQVGDECVCNKGYDFEETETACYPDLRCGSVYDNMEQKDGHCVCLDGFPFVGETGCYQEIDCPTHATQRNNGCVCTAAYPVPTYASDGTLESCGQCGAGMIYSGGQCICQSTDMFEVRDTSNVLTACVESIDCGHGRQIGDRSCSCDEGWTGDGTVCNECADGYNGDNCAPITCLFELETPPVIDGCGVYESCVDNYGKTLYSGNCETCADGYVYSAKSQKCVSKLLIGATQQVGNTTITVQNISTSTDYADREIRGLFNGADEISYGVTGAKISGSSAANATNTITILNDYAGGTAGVYGIYGGTTTTKTGMDYDTVGSYNNGGRTTGGSTAQNTIQMTNVSNGDVYGLFSSNHNTRGAVLESGSYTFGPNSANATKSLNTVTITNTGDGNVYGAYGAVGVFGAWAGPDTNSAGNNTNGLAQNTITITNTGNGNVYGLKSGTNAARGVETSDVYKGSQTGEKLSLKNTLTIKNTGTEAAAIYGMYGQSGVRGANIGMAGSRIANTISVRNAGPATVYGMYREGSGDFYGAQSTSQYWASSSNLNAPEDQWNAKNTVSVTNIGAGDVYGVLGPGTFTGAIQSAEQGHSSVYNTIELANIGGGTVYGIRADTIIASQGTSLDWGNYNPTDPSACDGIPNCIVDQGGKLQRFAQNTVSINHLAGVTDGVATGATIGLYGNTGITAGGNRYTQRSFDGDTITLNYMGGNYTGNGQIVTASTDNTRAYGIYASSGAGVNSSALITIKRNAWTDTLGTTDTADDITYTPTDTVSGTAFGIYGEGGNTITLRDAKTISSQESVTEIDINANTENGAGIYVANGAGSTVTVSGDIKIQNTTNAYGIYMGNGSGKTLELNNKGSINVNATDNAYGLYIGTGTATVTNAAPITVSGKNTYGIYVAGSGTITNTGAITVDGTENAYGIYVADGANSTITNSGTLTVNGTENAYGIYVVNGTGTTVVNSGTIKLNGVEPDDTNWTDGKVTYGKYIVLNGATLENSGLMNADFLNIASLGGSLMATPGARFQVEDAFSGALNISPAFTTNGFETTYVANDMISASDTSGLHLTSGSALFDAELSANGHDVVMKMKAFDAVTDNKSLAHFLSKNYALGNNEAFYNALKNLDNMKAVNNALNKLTGKQMLSRFNFEDMTMMRELNFDMNEKLFHNHEEHFSSAGSVKPMAFRGDTGSNIRYSLYNKRDGNTSVGLGVAFTNTRSDNAHESDDRRETSYQLILPMGYKAGGFHLLASPRIGYARGTYDRTGFDGTGYDGVIEKRIFGLMNEMRYPIVFGKWRFEPGAELNVLGYQQKGHEQNKAFALNIPNQNTYSIEGGIGLYTTYDEQLDAETSLKLTTGLALYHEFLDPYRVKVGMNGMEGAFTLKEERRSPNRGVIRAGFDYVYRDLSLYGTLTSYIDDEARTSAKTGMKILF